MVSEKLSVKSNDGSNDLGSPMPKELLTKQEEEEKKT